jgi:hypothetical protein
MKDEYGLILVNFTHLIHIGDNITDDPFIFHIVLSSISSILCCGWRNPDWVVVLQTKARDVYDDGQGESNEDNVETYHECEPFNLQIQDTYEREVDNDELVWNDIEGITVDNSAMVRIGNTSGENA